MTFVVETFTGATFFVAIVAYLNELEHLSFFKCAIIETTDSFSPEPEEDSEKPSRFLTKRKVLIIGGVVVTLVCIGGVWYLIDPVTCTWVAGKIYTGIVTIGGYITLQFSEKGDPGDSSDLFDNNPNKEELSPYSGDSSQAGNVPPSSGNQDGGVEESKSSGSESTRSQEFTSNESTEMSPALIEEITRSAIERFDESELQSRFSQAMENSPEIVAARRVYTTSNTVAASSFVDSNLAPDVTIEQAALLSDKADSLYNNLKSLQDQLAEQIREQYLQECIRQELESRGLNIPDI
jgi:hypothetical protein